MGIQFLTDPDLVPRRREDIRIQAIEAVFYADGKRLRISLSITPFFPRDKPNITIQIFDNNNEDLASVVVIESIQSEIGVTVHLPNPAGEGTILKGVAQLYFLEMEIQHQIEFIIGPYQRQSSYENF